MKSPITISPLGAPWQSGPAAATVGASPSEQYMRSIDTYPKNPTTRGSGGGGSTFTPPMWLTQSSTIEILVTDATVNGITPTNIATAIDISGTNSTWSIYLHATLGSDGIPTAVEVLTDNTNSIPADDDSNSYLRIGSAVVAAAVITSVSPTLAWSQTFVTCGRDPADPTTTPGTYFWQVG